MFLFFGPQEIWKIALIFETQQMFFCRLLCTVNHFYADYINLGLYLRHDLYCILIIYLTHFIIFRSPWSKSSLIAPFSWEGIRFFCFLDHVLDIVNVTSWWLSIMLYSSKECLLVLSDNFLSCIQNENCLLSRNSNLGSVCSSSEGLSTIYWHVHYSKARVYTQKMGAFSL